MKLEVVRLQSTKDATIGALFNVSTGQRTWLAWTLEDEHRTKKKMEDTRIPAGTYRIELRTEGGHHLRYAQKFRDQHIGMLWIRDVPGFKYVLIHIGNNDDDTAGCLLVGNTVGDEWIGGSTAAYRRIYPEIAAAVKGQQEPVFITFTDYDTPPLPT